MAKVFIDSTIFVESMKDNKNALDILKYLLESEHHLFVNPSVCEEVIYILKKRRPTHIKVFKNFILDNYIEILSIDENIVFYFFDLVGKYDIPSTADLLHLATCKYHNIKYLATLDEDFIKPAKKEKITLLMSRKDVEKI